MIYAASRMLYGGMQHNPPSRFLSEIDANFAIDTGGYGNYGLDVTSASLDEQPTNDEPRYVPDLEEGDQVKHQVFGKVTVLEVDGDIANIYFKGKGTKKINVSFAPIEKL